jgi:hypothetical protein
VIIPPSDIAAHVPIPAQDGSSQSTKALPSLSQPSEHAATVLSAVMSQPGIMLASGASPEGGHPKRKREEARKQKLERDNMSTP